MLGIPAVRVCVGQFPRHARPYHAPRPLEPLDGAQLREWSEVHGFDTGPGDGGWYGFDCLDPGPVRLVWRRTPAELRAALTGWAAR